MKKVLFPALIPVFCLLIGCAAFANSAVGVSSTASSASETVSEAATPSAFTAMRTTPFSALNAELCYYTGSQPIRLYPEDDAPPTDPYGSGYGIREGEAAPQNESVPLHILNYYTFNDRPNRDTWALVWLPTQVSGYIKVAEQAGGETVTLGKFEKADAENTPLLQNAAGLDETLGGIRPGDSYPKALANLAYDYIVDFENGPFYVSNGSKPFDAAGWWTSSQTFRFWGQPLISYLTATSPEFALGTGFKVGDSTQAVFAFYTKKYGAPEKTSDYDPSGNKTGYVFRFGNGLAELGFEISGKEPSGDSKIVSITLSCSNAPPG